jgi:hypothetical protein
VGDGVEAELVVACLGRGGCEERVSRALLLKSAVLMRHTWAVDLGDRYNDDENGDEDGGEAGPG